MEITTLTFHTNHGPIKFNVWDIVAQEKKDKMNESILTSANCTIIMFDVTQMSKYENVPKWHKRILEICPNIPMILAGNKVISQN